MAGTISDVEIPLAPGLDTASTLDWSKQAGFGGGPVVEWEIRRLLQANAARDWLWFAAHHDLTDEQRAIISDPTVARGFASRPWASGSAR